MRILHDQIRRICLASGVVLAGAAGSAVAQEPALASCGEAFTSDYAGRLLQALSSAAAVPAVWDDYTLAAHPLLLLADTTFGGSEGTPVCAAIWRADRPLEVVELVARPPLATPLYGMINLYPVGPGAAGGPEALGSLFAGLTPELRSHLRQLRLDRAVVLEVPLDLDGLGALGEMLKKAGVDPVLVQADLAVHESFHLHSQFPTWLDQPGSSAWPAWDTQPDRAGLRARCYAPSDEIAAAVTAERDALLAAFDALYAEDRSPDTAAALAHARTFVARRLDRYERLDTARVPRGDETISCRLAEDLMELEEGTAQWLAHATMVRAGLTSLERQRGSYAGQQPERFYQTGPLQLWILAALLDPPDLRRLTASIARSAGPEGALFAEFERHTRSGGDTPVHIRFVAASDSFAGAVAEYERIWREEGARIVAAMEARSGLRFVRPEYADTAITAHVLERPSHSGYRDRPMRLRASYPYDTKRATLVHELGHRLQTHLFTRDEEEHPQLFLWIYDVWVDLWGRDFADAQVAVEKRRGERYVRAWDSALALSPEERARAWSRLLQERAGR